VLGGLLQLPLETTLSLLTRPDKFQENAMLVGYARVQHTLVRVQQLPYRADAEGQAEAEEGGDVMGTLR
jgi:hypothetical protein